MSNPNKDKGTKAETAFVRFAQKMGYHKAERIDLGQGWGDVRIRDGLHAQVKNSPTKYSIITPPVNWIQQAWKQALRASEDLDFHVDSFLVVKPQGIGYSRVLEWHAWIPFATVRSSPCYSEQLVDFVFVPVSTALRLYEN